MTSAITHAEIAPPLAAALPARQGAAWRVLPALYLLRPYAATSRITDGRRSLVVVEQAGRVEVFVDRYDDFPIGLTPDAVADAGSPDVVATLAAAVLRTVLPAIDDESAARTAHRHGSLQALTRKGGDLAEIGYALLSHSVYPSVGTRLDGPHLAWAVGCRDWGVLSLGPSGTFTVTYEGPVSGLYGFLAHVLPPYDGPALPGVSSAFTWHLTGRFPQLLTVKGNEVEFRPHSGPHGFVMLPSEDDPTDQVDDTTRVAAQIGGLGADLLITAAAHLI
ncbi:hypothetical protein ACFWCA_19165 [Streptomyces phaeochromogenes]|uniref:hypothetical protein n=1 Tax=Streptomyces phaeochromogenes TaxID=1923 RepID=UPI003687969A